VFAGWQVCKWGVENGKRKVDESFAFAIGWLLLFVRASVNKATELITQL